MRFINRTEREDRLMLAVFGPAETRCPGSVPSNFLADEGWDLPCLGGQR